MCQRVSLRACDFGTIETYGIREEEFYSIDTVSGTIVGST